MENIIDYIRHTNETFEEKKWNEVDSLVLCQLVYLKFDGLVPEGNLEGKCRRNKEKLTIRRIDQSPERERLFRDERYAKDNREFWVALIHSRRFQNVELDYMVDFVDKDTETQFAAVTFFLPDGGTYVAFRGTDESIVGWKEDFNLAFSKPVPAQEKSVVYLNQVAHHIRGPLYVGGHSKGGNLAIYASMYCNPRIQNKITGIYSMDGPGFRPETLQQGNYEAIRERVTKILPHSSLVGMLFEKRTDFEIVESSVTGLMQHYPLTWVVQGNCFVKVNKLYEPAHFLDDTINEWIYSLDEEHTRIFVDTLFEVLYASESDNLIDFTADWMKSMQKVLTALSGLDEQTKEAVRSVIRTFFEMGRYHMKEEVTGLLKNTKAKIEGEGL